MVQEVIRVMGGSRGSFAHSPAAHLLLCSCSEAQGLGTPVLGDLETWPGTMQGTDCRVTGKSYKIWCAFPAGSKGRWTAGEPDWEVR